MGEVCREGMDRQLPGVRSSRADARSAPGNTDMPLCTGRVPLEAHLITLNLDSKSLRHVKGKCSIVNLQKRKRSKSPLVISLLKYSGSAFWLTF